MLIYTITNTSSTKGKLAAFYKNLSPAKYELIKLRPGDSAQVEAEHLDRKAWATLTRLSTLGLISISSTEDTLPNNLGDDGLPIVPSSTSLSIIIPTFNNTKYLLQLTSSIDEAGRLLETPPEVIFGIDNCQKTLDFMRQHSSIFSKYKVYFFNKNVGPYIVKNTLVNYATYESMLFFDSDDIMTPDALKAVYNGLHRAGLCLLKFANFYDGDEERLIHVGSSTYAPGIIGIKKTNFLSINGYQPWRCGADTEFKSRYLKRVGTAAKIDQIIFKRRFHQESLTKAKETGMGSALRSGYVEEIDRLKSKGYPNPKQFYIENDVELISLD